MANLPKMIPPGTLFEKLRGGEDPYRCVEWKDDQRSVFCMYYQVSSNKKRVPLSEIEAAARHLEQEKSFDRKAFKILCPISHGSGTCGFAVIGRILEKVFCAEYAGNEGFILV